MIHLYGINFRNITKILRSCVDFVKNSCYTLIANGKNPFLEDKMKLNQKIVKISAVTLACAVGITSVVITAKNSNKTEEVVASTEQTEGVTAVFSNVWNTENVYIENSTIIGEYFGRNSKNITLKNCIIDSNQGFCYIENLRLIDCKLENTDLAFEYSSIEADIIGDVVSIKNPLFGYINCDSVKEIIIDENCKKPCRTQIFQRKLEKSE